MSRLLSRIGIGAATVDTILPKTEFSPGESVEATVEMTGGASEQVVDEVYISLLAQIGDEDRIVDEFTLTDSVTLEPEEERTSTTPVTIPAWTPITGADSRVWLETGLDISWAVDPNDEDEITVQPGPILAALFVAVDELGFERRGSEFREPNWLDDRPFVQAFRFAPREDVFRTDVEGLTIVCMPRDDDLKTVVEIDEAEPAEEITEVEFDQQEIVQVFDTSHEDIVLGQLKGTIDQYTNT